jgi:hypothetical protein
MAHNHFKTDDGDCADWQPASTAMVLAWLEEDGMDPRRFDRLTQTLATARSRRAALTAFLAAAGSALGLGVLLAGEALADCAADGASCLQSDDCCSGLCKKKRHSHKKFCRAALDQGICTIAEDYCGPTTTLACGSPDCQCARRANGASVCATIPDLRCAFEGDCTDKKCRTLLNNKQAFCGASSATNGCCDQTGVCLLPCASPDSLP